MGYDPIEVSQTENNVLKALYKSGKVGRTEKPVITFNGDTTGYETGLYQGIQVAVLENKYFDPDTIEHITVFVEGHLIELDKSRFYGESISSGEIQLVTIYTAWRGGDVPIILISKNTKTGEGVFSIIADPNYNAYVKHIEFAETIHPIDPKYLPGVCLPVVEITSAAYPESGTVELSAEESVKLDAAVAEGFPVVVKMTVFGMPAAVVCTYLGGEMLNGFIVETSIGFAKDDTVWKMGEV